MLYDHQSMLTTCSTTLDGDGSNDPTATRHDGFVALLDSLIAKVVRATQTESVGEGSGGGGSGGSEGAAKTKSMVQLKQEAKERQRRKRIAIADVAMLVDVIRLMDHVLQSCGVQIMIRASEEFYNRIEGDPRQANQRLFSISVKFTEDSLVLEPGLEPTDRPVLD